jgi:YggT family protein
MQPFLWIISALFWFVGELLRLYFWVVILAAIFSTLASFGVLDTRNRTVWTIGDFLYRLTDPVLRPIRNMLPNFGSVDISPIIVILLLQVAQSVVVSLCVSVTGGRPTLIF